MKRKGSFEENRTITLQERTGGVGAVCTSASLCLALNKKEGIRKCFCQLLIALSLSLSECICLQVVIEEGRSM
jgi:hypothetical protein